MDTISYGDASSGMVVGIEPVYANGVLDVSGTFYKFTEGKISDVRLTVELRDMLDNPIKILKNEQIPAIHPEELLKFEASENVSSIVHGGYYKVVFKLTTGDGNEILSCQRYVKMGPMRVPNFDKPLKLVFMWEIHQPLYPDREASRVNIKQFAGIYRNIAELYLKHPRVRTDFCMSGSLLYQLAQFYPESSKNTANWSRKDHRYRRDRIGHPLFPFIDNNHIERQLQLDIALKKFLFDVYRKAFTCRKWLHEQDIASSHAEPTSGGIRGQAFRRIGYRNLQAVDYAKPSRIVGTGGMINALIRDPAAVNILLKKNDRAVDEFIQYLINAQEGNDGSKVIVVANNGEFIGNGKFMDQLFTELEAISWIKFQTIEDVFTGYYPVPDASRREDQRFVVLRRRTPGIELQALVRHATKKQIWTELSNGESVVLIVYDKIVKAQTLVGYDFSYPTYLFEMAWKNCCLPRNPMGLVGKRPELRYQPDRDPGRSRHHDDRLRQPDAHPET
jgi:hypothetical protein